MIKLYVPDATLLQMTTFFTGKGLRSHFYSATFGPGITPGFIVELDEPDENWDQIRETIVGPLAATIGKRVKVTFDEIDPSKLQGRLAMPSFWVDTDGTQSED
jgi:hypothetical protein